jgi:hypothetical protein
MVTEGLFMGGACRMNGEMRNARKVEVVKPEEGRFIGRIILK